MQAALIAMRFAHDAALAVLFGGAAYQLYAVPPRAWRRIAWSAVAAAVLSGAGWFALEGAMMSGNPAGAVDPTVLRTVLVATAFGRLWTFRLGLAAVAIAALARGGRRRSAADGVLAGAAGLVLITLAGTGHGGDGSPRWLHQAADVVHLGAAGLWFGGLVVFAARLSERPGWAEVERFSRIATVAVAAVLAGGIGNSLFLVGGWGALLSTAYGRTLLVKVALFGAALVPSLQSRRQIAARGDVRALRRSVAFEQGLLLLVLAATAILGTLPPPVP